jgi:chromate transporter
LQRLAASFDGTVFYEMDCRANALRSILGHTQLLELDRAKKSMKDANIPGRLKEVALLFLELGAFSIGGPAVYIALMHQETVRRRRWIDEQRFLDLVGATNLIPGPNAAEMAIHLGLIRAGWPGLIASGALFVLPGSAATLFVAWAYVTYGSIAEVGWVLYGVKPIVIGIVVDALSRHRAL